MINGNFFNLIERILIVGPVESDIEKIINKSNNTPNNLSNVASKILEEYRATNLIDENDLYTENINMVKALFDYNCLNNYNLFSFAFRKM